jgi:hypothetical protein
MKIVKVLNLEMSKEVFNEIEKEYHIPAIIDEQNEKECCYISVNYEKGYEEPSFLLFSDMKSEDMDYPFTNEEMDAFLNMISEYEKN